MEAKVLSAIARSEPGDRRSQASIRAAERVIASTD